MAKNLNDCEFSLPSQFLTDDDLLVDFNIGERNGGGKYLGRDFGHGFNLLVPHSDPNSPVESVIGSVDTDSDEEEYITGLTRKMVHSTLQDSGFGYGNTKGWSLSGSPQSTLCGCKHGSSRGSPNFSSQASSPPLVNQSDGSLDQFYAAAIEVAGIKIVEDATRLYQTNTEVWPSPEKISNVPVAPKNSNQSLGLLNSNQPSLSYQQLQVAQFQRLKQQQIMKQGGFGQYPVTQNKQQLAHSRGQSRVARPINSSIYGSPTLQQSPKQQPGSGMRAVFLENPGPKGECAGTGVFLPRRIGTQTETRKKPGCSTVLLPDRVVQALNLNLEAMDVRQQTQVYSNGGSGSKYWNNMTATQQIPSVRSENTYSQTAPMSQELFLPHDWTY